MGGTEQSGLKAAAEPGPLCTVVSPSPSQHASSVAEATSQPLPLASLSLGSH